MHLSTCICLQNGRLHPYIAKNYRCAGPGKEVFSLQRGKVKFSGRENEISLKSARLDLRRTLDSVIHGRATGQLADQMSSPGDYLPVRVGPAFGIAPCGELWAKEFGGVAPDIKYVRV